MIYTVDDAHKLVFIEIEIHNGVSYEREVSGECFYVDDEAGLARCYVADDAGAFHLDPVSGELVWEELIGKVRVEKA